MEDAFQGLDQQSLFTPITKRNALVETTWISELNNEKLKDYDEQIDNYLSKHLNIRNCKIDRKSVV